MSQSMINLPYHICVQERIWSACAPAVRMKERWIPGYPWNAWSEEFDRTADAQADLSLRWAHVPYCRFSRVPA